MKHLIKLYLSKIGLEKLAVRFYRSFLFFARKVSFLKRIKVKVLYYGRWLVGKLDAASLVKLTLITRFSVLARVAGRKLLSQSSISSDLLKKSFGNSSFVKLCPFESARFFYYRQFAIKQAYEVCKSGKAIFEKDANFREMLSSERQLLASKPALPQKVRSSLVYKREQKILYVANQCITRVLNGYTVRTQSLLKSWQSMNISFIALERPGSNGLGFSKIYKEKTSIHEGIKYYHLPCRALGKGSILKYLHACSSYIEEFARKHGVTSIHAASSYENALPALMAARRLGLPFVYEVRGLWEVTKASYDASYRDSDRYNLTKEMNQYVVENADEVAVISSSLSAYLKENVCNRPYIVAQNGAGRQVKVVRSSLNNEGKLIIGFIGSITAYEGLDDLLKALSQVRTDKYELRIAGSGPYLDNLKEIVEDFKLQDTVKFLGSVSRNKVEEFYSEIDIVALPRKPLEICKIIPPLKPFEALCHGKTLIVPNLEPLKEILVENKTAYFYEAGNIDTLRNLLEAIVQRDTPLLEPFECWDLVHTWEESAKVLASCHKKNAKIDALPSVVDLSSFTVALISDKFTFDTFINERIEILYLTPEGWRKTLSEGKIDLFICESAWAGVDGVWKEKIGFYGSTKFKTITEITREFRRLGIPSVFFNKEDPVHIERFLQTARLFDHVFSSDLNALDRYISNASAENISFGVWPFAAQPSIHNPMVDGKQAEPLEKVMYAGSYYGDRYPDRSKYLDVFLNQVPLDKIDIFDRQLAYPDSPYHFPAKFKKIVKGSLSPDQMLEANKKYAITLNVNSVFDSPSMFSRRLVENFMSGSCVVSSRSYAIQYLFDDKVPAFSDERSALKSLSLLCNGDERNSIAQRMQRDIYRNHLICHRLEMCFRHASISYGVSHAYVKVVCTRAFSSDYSTQVRSFQSVFIDEMVSLEEWQKSERNEEGIILFLKDLSLLEYNPYFVEDLLNPLFFNCNVNSVSVVEGKNRQQMTLVDFDLPHDAVAVRNDHAAELVKGKDFIKWAEGAAVSPKLETSKPSKKRRKTTKIKIAGHDLKFVRTFIQDYFGDDSKSQSSYQIVEEKWFDHSWKERGMSNQPSSDIYEYDIVWAEWALGNAVFYSRNLLPSQKLFIRFHAQELNTDFPKKIDLDRVDKIIFVAEHIRRAALEKFGWPKELTEVIPNYISRRFFKHNDWTSNRFRLGMVGYVPKLKRLDLALDLLEGLNAREKGKYELHLAGKSPFEIEWLMNIPEQKKYFEAQFKRIEESQGLKGSVIIEGHIDNIEEWYSKIGYILSLSDSESYHMALAEGVASGCKPIVLKREGVKEIFKGMNTFDDIDSVISFIIEGHDFNSYSLPPQNILRRVKKSMNV